MAKKPPSLRAVGEDERPPEPPAPELPAAAALEAAVLAGDVLAMLTAQRRIMIEGLVAAASNTQPQLNNEINKLHTLIREEEARLKAAAKEEAEASGTVPDAPFDASAV